MCSMRIAKIAARIASTERNILILVHPDMLPIGWSMHPEVQEEYFRTMKRATAGLNLDKKFALLYFMNRKDGDKSLVEKELKDQNFEIIRDTSINPNTNWPDVHLGERAFNNEIGNYVMNALEKGDQIGTVYIAGGYRGLCVDGVCSNFRSIFDGILEEPTIHLFEIQELIIDHPNMKGGVGRFDPYYDISKGWRDPEPLYLDPRLPKTGQ